MTCISLSLLDVPVIINIFSLLLHVHTLTWYTLHNVQLVLDFMVENEKFKFTIREGVASTNKAGSKKHTKRLAQLKRVTRFFFSRK